MEIVATKRLKDGLNFAIEYMKDGQLHCLFISAEKVVKNYEAVEQQRALDVCPDCFDTGYRRVSPTILAKCSCKHGQRQ